MNTRLIAAARIIADHKKTPEYEELKQQVVDELEGRSEVKMEIDDDTRNACLMILKAKG